VGVPDTFSIGEAAAILGIPAPTLRAWERRYGILKPRRTRTNQRRYTVSDLQVLARVKEATSQAGVPLRRAVNDEKGRLGSGSEHSAAIPLDHESVWRFVVDLFDQPILLVDAGGRVLDANAAVARDLGVDREQLRGNRLSAYLHRGDQDTFESITRPPLQQRPEVFLTLSSGRVTHGLYFDCWPVGHDGTPMLALIGLEPQTVETRDLHADLRDRGR
jgi:PAS domain-containing protein